MEYLFFIFNELEYSFYFIHKNIQYTSDLIYLKEARIINQDKIYKYTTLCFNIYYFK